MNSMQLMLNPKNAMLIVLEVKLGISTYLETFGRCLEVFYAEQNVKTLQKTWNIEVTLISLPSRVTQQFCNENLMSSGT